MLFSNQCVLFVVINVRETKTILTDEMSITAKALRRKAQRFCSFWLWNDDVGKFSVFDHRRLILITFDRRCVSYIRWNFIKEQQTFLQLSMFTRKLWCFGRCRCVKCGSQSSRWNFSRNEQVVAKEPMKWQFLHGDRTKCRLERNNLRSCPNDLRSCAFVLKRDHVHSVEA